MPVATKAARQPKARVSPTTRGGASIAPKEVPTLNQPVAADRSAPRNHSPMAFMPAGIAVASVAPSPPRRTASPTQPPANACSMPATDHRAANRAKPARRPIRSSTKPQTGCIRV